jgi:hypothetical protein
MKCLLIYLKLLGQNLNCNFMAKKNCLSSETGNRTCDVLYPYYKACLN